MILRGTVDNHSKVPYQKLSMQEEESQISRKLLTPSGIQITTVTWNLFGSLPPHNSLAELAATPHFHPEPHIIFFATQECERDLWKTLCCEAKDQWEAMLKEVFSSYQLKFCEVMRGLHSACLVNKSCKDDVKLYRVNKLKYGVGGYMGTKGAISTVILFMGELIQFINCHLASGQGEYLKRNETIQAILTNIVEKESSCDIIFSGDFNYRIDITNEEYQKIIKGSKENTEKNMKYLDLIERDQLNRQKTLKQNFLLQFEENPISFPPTYKLGLEEEVYSRNRIPGWTDRIFNKISPTLKRNSYDCEYKIRGCDHRPVLATFTKISGGPVFSLSKADSSACQLI